MEELLSIKEYFKSINILLTDDFLLAVKKFYTETKGAAKLINLKDFVFYQWLHCDIGDTTAPRSLPLNTSANGTVLINQVFQINWTIRIDVSLYSIYTELSETKADLAWFNNQDDNDENFHSSSKYNLDEFEKNRILLMELSDGVNVIQAIEREPILGLKTILAPGTKIALHGYVSFSNKIFYINNTLATILGGDVEEQYNRNNTMSVIERKLHLPYSFKMKIKQIQECKKKRICLPEHSEASKEIMKQWLNKSRTSAFNISNDSVSSLEKSYYSNDNFSSSGSSIDKLIDMNSSYGSDIVSRENGTTFCSKVKKKIDDLFQSPSNKIEKNKSNSSSNCLTHSPKLEKITGFYTPLKKKFVSLITPKGKGKKKSSSSSENYFSISPNNQISFFGSHDDANNSFQSRELDGLKIPSKRSCIFSDQKHNTFDKTPISKNEKILKRGLSLRKPSQENILNNQTFCELFRSPKTSITRLSQKISNSSEKSPSKNNESSPIKGIIPELHYELEPQFINKKCSNSNGLSRLPSDNQSPLISSIIPLLDKTSSKREKDTLSSISQFLKPQVYQTQDKYFGFKEDKLPSVIDFRLDACNIKPKVLYKRQNLNISDSKNSSNFSNRYSYEEPNENSQFNVSKSHSMLSDSYESRNNSHSDIGVMNISNQSSDFDKESFTMSHDRTTISLTQTPLYVKKRAHLNTSNNSDVFFTPPNKLVKFDSIQQDHIQQPTNDYVTISEAKKLVAMSFGVEKLNIKAKVTKITKNLTTQNNQWTMEVEIKDENDNSLICLIHDSFISGFLGMTALEGLALKVSSNENARQEGGKKIAFLLKRLKMENLIFSVDMFASQSITPVIRKIRTVKQLENEASQTFSQHIFNYI